MKHPSLSPGQPVLIAAHASRVVESANDGVALGRGAFVAALEHASSVPTHEAGKPRARFSKRSLQTWADLGGSPLELGLWRMHVRTGKYRPGDAPRRCPA
ncbi:hypothetical protein B0H17DRAFT_1219138 [Mycena rosella]|uniref:Uncharacterized protein n=1 Tax=Mycena rosella TaxID=1033263 RepID=A0AAD7BJB1_MYCRO|nr:hypothetical protein B0H17DRAFT_1219138 [Mycena rosella]